MNLAGLRTCGLVQGKCQDRGKNLSGLGEQIDAVGDILNTATAMLGGSKHRWGCEIEPEYLGAGCVKLCGRRHLGAGAKDHNLAL